MKLNAEKQKACVARRTCVQVYVTDVKALHVHVEKPAAYCVCAVDHPAQTKPATPNAAASVSSETNPIDYCTFRTND